jgi:hypothetical protein
LDAAISRIFAAVEGRSRFSLLLVVSIISFS